MKGQVIGQVFIYILAIVLVAIILTFGIKAYMYFDGQSKNAAYLEFRTDLTNAVKTTAIDYGSVIKKEIRVPGDYKEVCFVKTYGSPTITTDTLFTNRKIIERSVDDGNPENVFLVGKVIEKQFDIGAITVSMLQAGALDPKEIVCIPSARGYLILRLEGMGNHVDISQWNS